MVSIDGIMFDLIFEKCLAYHFRNKKRRHTELAKFCGREKNKIESIQSIEGGLYSSFAQIQKSPWTYWVNKFNSDIYDTPAGLPVHREIPLTIEKCTENNIFRSPESIFRRLESLKPCTHFILYLRKHNLIVTRKRHDTLILRHPNIHKQTLVSNV